jgi:hypothetical protein
LVAALEDDAVEFVLRDGDGEVGFCLAAGGKTGEEFGIEERGPYCLGRDTPVEESEEGSRRVVNAWILGGLLNFSRFLCRRRAYAII